MKKYLFMLITLTPLFASASVIERLLGGYGTADSKGLHHAGHVYQDKDQLFKLKFEKACTAILTVAEDSLSGICEFINEQGQKTYYSAIVFIESDESQFYWKTTLTPEEATGFKNTVKATKLF